MNAPLSPSSLAQIHIFTGLREDTLALLASCCLPMAVKTGDVIMEEGATGREMYLIGEGRVRMVQHSAGAAETELAELSSGHFFGEVGVIDCGRRSATAVAVEPCLLYSLHTADLYRIFKKWPEQFSIIILNISRDLCRRLRTTNDRLAEALHSAAVGELSARS